MEKSKQRVRKNGVNRSLTPISGGLCAPNGFRFSRAKICLPSSEYGAAMDGARDIDGGTAYGVPAATKPCLEPASRNSQRQSDCNLSLGLLMSEKPVPTACLFSEGDVRPYSQTLYRRNASDGRLQASMFVLGASEMYSKNPAETYEDILFGLVKAARFSAQRMCLFPLGKIYTPYPKAEILSAVPALYAGLNEVYTEKKAATAFSDAVPAHSASSNEGFASQACEGAFAFSLGDFPCKMGFVATKRRGGGLTAVMTTDVNVSPALLQKALHAAAKETFYLSGGENSRFDDLIMITSSCTAGNYIIGKEDGEYEKFLSALTLACGNVCKETLATAYGAALQCKVLGAKSKTASRAAVCALADYLTNFDPAADDLLSLTFSALGKANCSLSLKNAQILLGNQTNGLCLMEEGRIMRYKTPRLIGLFREKELCLTVRLNDGNFASTAWSGLGLQGADDEGFA